MKISKCVDLIVGTNNLENRDELDNMINKLLNQDIFLGLHQDVFESKQNAKFVYVRFYTYEQVKLTKLVSLSVQFKNLFFVIDAFHIGKSNKIKRNFQKFIVEEGNILLLTQSDNKKYTAYEFEVDENTGEYLYREISRNYMGCQYDCSSPYLTTPLF